MDIAINPELLSQPDFIQDWQFGAQSPVFQQFEKIQPSQIEQYVNGKHLACPMPLLKLKMALRQTAIGNHVYVTATDPNSQKDIGAYCQHAGYAFVFDKQAHPEASDDARKTSDNKDTIFHLLITKNC